MTNIAELGRALRDANAQAVFNKKQVQHAHELQEAVRAAEHAQIWGPTIADTERDAAISREAYNAARNAYRDALEKYNGGSYAGV